MLPESVSPFSGHVFISRKLVFLTLRRLPKLKSWIDLIRLQSSVTVFLSSDYINVFPGKISSVEQTIGSCQVRRESSCAYWVAILHPSIFWEVSTLKRELIQIEFFLWIFMSRGDGIKGTVSFLLHSLTKKNLDLTVQHSFWWGYFWKPSLFFFRS